MSKPVTITKYAPPKLADWIAISGILALYGSGVAAPWISPDTKIWDLLTQYFPGGPARFLWIASTIVPVLALTHALESLLFDRFRMQKHGVPRWSALWWKWEISCFVEGIGAWKRIGEVIAKQGSLKRK